MPEALARTRGVPDMPPLPMSCAALEVSTDQVSWSVAGSDGIRVLTGTGLTFDQAIHRLQSWTPPVVVAHQAVVNRLPADLAAIAAPMKAHEVAAAASRARDPSTPERWPGTTRTTCARSWPMWWSPKSTGCGGSWISGPGATCR